MIALLSRDLMVISTVSGAAQQMGLQLKSVDRLAPLESLPADEITLFAIDLGAAGNEVAAVVSQIQTKWPNARIVAFGPHVATDVLATANSAGCDHVMARGQFLMQLNTILAWPAKQA